MKTFLPCALLMLSAGMMQASILQSINFDLSALHPNSTLSGTFALSNFPTPGDTASAVLSFSDPADYTPSPVTVTIAIGNGTSFPYTVGFDTITFANPSGNTFTKNVSLVPNGMAQCAAFPCTATGGFADGSPAAFTATYHIAPASTAAVPEPGYGWLMLPIAFFSFVFGKRMVRRDMGQQS